jgi:uncharacterized protein YcaQ
VLWSRLGDYPQPWLEHLLAEGALFEYWAHEACFVPIEDYGLYRHRMIDPGSMGWNGRAHLTRRYLRFNCNSEVETSRFQ